MAALMGTDLSPQKRLPPKEMARSPSFVKREGQASFAGHDVRGQLKAQLAAVAKADGEELDLRAVFNKWDADGNGTLDRQEFQWMLDTLKVGERGQGGGVSLRWLAACVVSRGEGGGGGASDGREHDRLEDQTCTHHPDLPE